MAETCCGPFARHGGCKLDVCAHWKQFRGGTCKKIPNAASAEKLMGRAELRLESSRNFYKNYDWRSKSSRNFLTVTIFSKITTDFFWQSQFWKLRLFQSGKQSQLKLRLTFLSQVIATGFCRLEFVSRNFIATKTPVAINCDCFFSRNYCKKLRLILYRYIFEFLPYLP